MVSLIAAVADKNAIGLGNELLCRISEDLKHFKKLTMSKTLIMGRKTFESLPGILPGRKHVVLTRDKNYKCDHKQVFVRSSLEEAIQEFDKRFDEVFVIGGGEVYAQAIKMASLLYITRIYKTFEADTFFPKIDTKVWDLYEQFEPQKDKATGIEYNYQVYRRR